MQQLIPKIDVEAKYLRIMYFLDLGIFGKNNHFFIPRKKGDFYKFFDCWKQRPWLLSGSVKCRA